MCFCMWDYLHLTIPPRIKLPRIAAIRGNCQDLLCSLIRLSGWHYLDGCVGGVSFVVVFFFLLAPFPFLKSAGAHILYKILFYDTFGVFEILSRSLAMGQGKGIFELDLCGNIFLKISSNFTEVVLVTPVHNHCFTYPEWI